VGRTPYQKDIPGGYLHKTRTSLGSRLEHPMIARLTLDGYAAKEIQLTEGPTNWVSFKGHNYGGYWLLKTDHFHVELQSASQTFTGGVESAASTTAEPRPELSLEELVSHTKPAVVYLSHPRPELAAARRPARFPRPANCSRTIWCASIRPVDR
jgi:hypothetical protein